MNRAAFAVVDMHLQRVHVVGHDWGAVVADAFDQLEDAAIASTVTIMAVPINFVHSLLQQPSQVQRDAFHIAAQPGSLP